MHVFVKIMEAGMRQPSFIEMQSFDFPVEHFFDGFYVVDHPVISGLSNGQDARYLVLGITGEGIGFDFFHDVLHPEFFDRNGADDAQMISGRHQEHRDCATHDDGVQH